MSIFNDSNSFRNVGIKNSNNELIVMNISTSSNNLSFHSSTSDNNVDIMNIKTILNKDSNNDLNLSSFDGSSINPVIQINNITQNFIIQNICSKIVKPSEDLRLRKIQTCPEAPIFQKQLVIDIFSNKALKPDLSFI